MTDEKLQLLVVEDDEDDYLLVRDLLQGGTGAEVDRAASADQALERSAGSHYDAMLLDYRLGAKNGLDVLRELRQRDVAAPVIFLTGHGDEQVAVEAMKAGATDYLAKAKLTQPSLAMAVRYAVSLRHKEEAVQAARRALHASEQRFRALVENGSDIITLIDAEGTILYSSQSARRIVGWAPEEVIDAPAFAHVHPEDEPRLHELFQLVLQSPGVPVRFEHRALHKDGRYVVLESTGVNRLQEDAVRAVVVNSRDVSERRRAEEALRQSERDYRTLFENANDAIMIFEPEGEAILEVNPKACEMYGFSRKELLAMSLKDVTRDVERGREAIESCLSEGWLKDFDTVHHRRDGAPIYILANASVIDYRGRKAILSLSRDVSERRAAQQEIYRLNRALMALSKCNQALLHATEQAQLLQEICDIVVELGGYRMAWVAVPREANRHPFAPAAWAGHVDGYFEVLELLWADCQRRRLPITVALLTGEPDVCRDLASDERFSSLRAECVRRGYGSMIALPLNLESRRFGALAIYSSERDAFDVPEVELLRELAANVSYGLNALHTQAQRERAEEELRQSEQRLRNLIETANEGIWTIDDRERTTFVNRKMAEMLGCTPEQMLGRELYEFMPPDEAARVKNSIRERQNALGHYETLLLRKDGTKICADLNSSPLLDCNGQYCGALAMISDITESRNLQEQLVHAKKIEAVGHLAGGVAHDFNNLLMVIGSHAELLHDSTAELTARRKAEEILEAVRRGASLTRQLLAFSRKQVLSPRLLQLNEMVAELGTMLPRMLGETMRVELRAGAGLWHVKADPAQIEQVIVNLAVNARDAMPHGGRLTLETCNVELGDEYARTHTGVQPGRYVMLAVSDTGEGIPRDILPHIFEPFFTTKEPGKGTGLGLATVYGIVQQSGGFIWVYSEVGQGTVFKIYLPQAEAPPPPVAATASAVAEQTASETILLVEDEEAVRAAASEFLSLRGYHVLQAGNGEDALALANRFAGPIHLVISDVVMPGMSGSDMARQLQALRPGTPVLFVSGYTESTVGQHGIGPASAFLQKPFSLSALAAKIRELLHSPIG